MLKEFNLEPQIEQIAQMVLCGRRIDRSQGLLLFEDAPLALLGILATAVRERVNGRQVFYNRNIHIEPTNICQFSCRFCSYRRAEGDPEAWYYDLDQIRSIARSHRDDSLTEVHIVGGVHPRHDLDHYCAMIRAVKEELPGVAVKAYSAVELHHIITKAGLSLRDGLARLKAAGMDAIPGGGAEIFDPEIRRRICPEKIDAEQWLDTHRQAHALGLNTNATILYGHVESYAHRIDHLERLRALQDETHGFDAMIPLKYLAGHNPMGAAGESSLPEQMRMMAMTRIYLDNVPHLKAYWPMLGIEATELALSFGADDIDGTIDDTTKIYSMAGAEFQKPTMSSEQMEQLIRRAGYEPCERDTFYDTVKK